ncbi:MAG: helix-turn-helix domain-containing protein [Anaerolineae bacterium]|nr:helix-turn-helix domain-containing protein [Anaerolineae bacterium]
MSDLARRLRDGRESLGVSLSQAEYDTKIRRRYIEAIESGDYVLLPDGLSARGYIRNYARYLGIDQNQALLDFEAEVGIPLLQATEVIPPPPSPTRSKMSSRFTITVPADEAEALSAWPRTETGLSVTNLGEQGNQAKRMLVDGRRDFSNSPSSFRLNAPKSRNVGGLTDGISSFGKSAAVPRFPSAKRPPALNTSALPKLPQIHIPPQLWRWLAGIIGAVLLVSAFVIWGLPALQNANIGATVQRILQPPQPTAVVLSTPIIVGNNPVPTRPATAAVVGSPTPVVIPPLPQGGMRLSLDPREHAWVRVKSDGAIVYEGIPAVGTSPTWNAKNNISIETGNAGAFDVLINGARLGSLGQRNSVARLSYNPQGQITALP